MVSARGCAALSGSYGVSPFSDRIEFREVAAPTESPCASCDSATMRYISRFDTTVREPYCTPATKAVMVFFRTGSGTPSIGSVRRIWQPIVLSHPRTFLLFAEGTMYRSPNRLSSRWFTSNPTPVLTVLELYLNWYVQSAT